MFSAVYPSNWINISLDFKVDAVQVPRPMQFILNFVATLFMFCCFAVCCRLLCAPSIPNNSVETYDCAVCAAAEQTANAFRVCLYFVVRSSWLTAVANNSKGVYGAWHYANYCSHQKRKIHFASETQMSRVNVGRTHAIQVSRHGANY